VRKNILGIDDACQFELCALFASKPESSCLGFSRERIGDDFFDYGHDPVSIILGLELDYGMVYAKNKIALRGVSARAGIGA